MAKEESKWEVGKKDNGKLYTNLKFLGRDLCICSIVLERNKSKCYSQWQTEIGEVVQRIGGVSCKCRERFEYFLKEHCCDA